MASLVWSKSAVLLEHLPQAHFQGSTQGVLLVIFGDGAAYFYPLSEDNKERAFQNASLLSNSPPTKKSSKGSAPSQTDQKYSLYDMLLDLPGRFKVHQFTFMREGLDKAIAEKPRKVILSPDKSLLLVLGGYHENRKCLLVYQIFQTFPSPFHLIYSDFAFTFVDACFSPDSRSLVFIPARSPDHLFLFSLPLIECPNNASFETTNSLFLSAAAKKNVEHHLYAKGKSAFQPRPVGPLQVWAPAVSAVTGHGTHMTHIVSSNDASDGAFHYCTWNESALGEFCLWSSWVDKSSGKVSFEVHPRLLWPQVTDFAWLNHADSPKTRIARAAFSDAAIGRLMMVVQHNKYGRQADNGLGVQSCDLSWTPKPTSASGPQQVQSAAEFGPWFHVSDSQDADDVVCCKWSQPLLLGKEPSASVIVRKEGFFELVSHRCGSAFQSLNERFSCTNFLQVGRFYRYWVNKDGELRALVVAPQVLSPHPEWIEVCRKGEFALGSAALNDLVTHRVLARRIGYFIQDVLRDHNPSTLSSLYASKKGSKGVTSSNGGGGGGAKKGKTPQKNHVEEMSSSHAVVMSSGADQLIGLHLHRCWECLAVLMKPLLCSRCKSAMYCSMNCQVKHWEETHSRSCQQANG